MRMTLRAEFSLSPTAQTVVLAVALGLLCGTGPALAQQPALGLRGPADETPTPAPMLTAPPNYGKPRVRRDPRLTQAGRAKIPAHALPALVPYATSDEAKRRARQPEDTLVFPPSPNFAVVQDLARKHRAAVDASPFVPVGFDVGSLRLSPYVEIDGGYDSNPDRSNGSTAKGSSFVRGEAGLDVKSNWAVHQFTATLRGGYYDYPSNHDANRPDGRGQADLRIDVTRDTALDFQARGVLDTQRPGSPELGTTAIQSRPLIASFGGTMGVTQTFNRLQIGVHGTADRTIYENATLTNGAPLRLSASNYNAFGVQTRVGYQITPGIVPFLEVLNDVRRHDDRLDANGFLRDSSGFAGKVGSTFELSRLLTGQIAVGYARRDYSDPRLRALAAPTIDAQLVWTATPLTTVTVRASTALSETDVANASGAVTRTASLEVSHALLRNVTVGAIGTIGTNDYKGISLHETLYAATIKADYSLSRSIVVRGSFTHERLQSGNPGSDYTANVFLLGMRFQR